MRSRFGFVWRGAVFPSFQQPHYIRDNFGCVLFLAVALVFPLVRLDAAPPSAGLFIDGSSVTPR